MVCEGFIPLILIRGYNLIFYIFLELFFGLFWTFWNQIWTFFANQKISSSSISSDPQSIPFEIILISYYKNIQTQSHTKFISKYTLSSSIKTLIFNFCVSHITKINLFSSIIIIIFFVILWCGIFFKTKHKIQVFDEPKNGLLKSY